MGALLCRTYEDFATLTPSDTVDDPAGCMMGLLVTAAGTLKVRTRSGKDFSLPAVVVGQEIHVPVIRVWSTGTSATVLGLIGAPYFGKSG